MERGAKQSEFAVSVDGEQVFSRLESRRFPDAKEIIAICRNR